MHLFLCRTFFESTKLSILMVCGTVCLLSGANALSEDNIFATPASTPTMVDRYPTAAVFLAATRSGEIPKMLHQTSANAGANFGPPLLNILVKEYGLGTKEYKDYHYTGRLGTWFGWMLQNLTDHEFNLEDKMPLYYFREHQEEVPEALRNVFNKFAVQYDGALKEYVASVQQKEKLAGIEERTRDDSTKKARVARERKLAEVFASSAYKQWEAAFQVQKGEELISNAQRMLDHDDAVQRESGVTDLAARRAAGEQMVAGKSLVETAFGSYRELGGKAATAKEVVAGSDPAADYR